MVKYILLKVFPLVTYWLYHKFLKLNIEVFSSLNSDKLIKLDKRSWVISSWYDHMYVPSNNIQTLTWSRAQGNNLINKTT